MSFVLVKAHCGWCKVPELEDAHRAGTQNLGEAAGAVLAAPGPASRVHHITPLARMAKDDLLAHLFGFWGLQIGLTALGLLGWVSLCVYPTLLFEINEMFK